MTPQGHACTSARRGQSARDLRTLFRRCSAGDVRAREAIIVGFLPYARQLARRYRGRGEPVEDLYQVASVGLIKAVDRYEPERGGSFVAYAAPTILGEIRRHFRDKTWPAHVPRSVQERAGRVARAQEELRATSGPDPTTEVIARHLGLELCEVAEAQGALQAYRPGSLDATCAAEDGERLALSEIVGELDAGYERVETSVGYGARASKIASARAQGAAVALRRRAHTGRDREAHRGLPDARLTDPSQRHRGRGRGTRSCSEDVAQTSENRRRGELREERASTGVRDDVAVRAGGHCRTAGRVSDRCSDAPKF